MRVTRQSSFSGKLHSWDIPATPNQMQEWLSPNRRLIQHIFPNLTPEQREFLQTGVTPDEWNEEFQPRTWWDMSEHNKNKAGPGKVIEMLKEVSQGDVWPSLKKGEHFTIVENNLNEMQPCLVVTSVPPVHTDEYSALIPGPSHAPVEGEPNNQWDEEASFKLVLEKRDASLGIVEVVE